MHHSSSSGSRASLIRGLRAGSLARAARLERFGTAAIAMQHTHLPPDLSTHRGSAVRRRAKDVHKLQEVPFSACGLTYKDASCVSPAARGSELRLRTQRRRTGLHAIVYSVLCDPNLRPQSSPQLSCIRRRRLPCEYLGLPPPRPARRLSPPRRPRASAAPSWLPKHTSWRNKLATRNPLKIRCASSAAAAAGSPPGCCRRCRRCCRRRRGSPAPPRPWR